jgi:hypothetical protein
MSNFHGFNNKKKKLHQIELGNGLLTFSTAYDLVLVRIFELRHFVVVGDICINGKNPIDMHC